MDCKELIKQLRDESTFQRERFSRFVLADELGGAATAIETLLAEREAALMYVPHNCHTCKWWKERTQGVTCCMRPEDSGFCRFDEPDLWQWRGPTPPDRQQTEKE